MKIIVTNTKGLNDQEVIAELIFALVDKSDKMIYGFETEIKRDKVFKGKVDFKIIK